MYDGGLHKAVFKERMVMQLLQITAAGRSTDEKTHYSVTIFQQSSEESALILGVEVQNIYLCIKAEFLCTLRSVYKMCD